MEFLEAQKYYQAISSLEAQEILKDYSISIYPNLKQDAQRKTHREIHKKAFPNNETMSIAEMESILNG